MYPGKQLQISVRRRTGLRDMGNASSYILSLKRKVLLQSFLYGVLGAVFAGCSVIWELECWGIVKQTGIYFLIVSVVMMPIAYISYWMEHSVKGILSYFGVFVFIFAVIWAVEYAIAKHNVKKMNETLYGKQDE